ncbi:hypothetical protein [Dactylosporangium sp. NPDC000521]|uniref:hypothetical protein n=1 Tax=Dactylosporangium sp. NPDC000521 TaxID=3363975 RepID=UPI00369868EC
MVVVCLADRPQRFTEPQVLLRAVTPTVLRETLRAMQRDGLHGPEGSADQPAARRVLAGTARWSSSAPPAPGPVHHGTRGRRAGR